MASGHRVDRGGWVPDADRILTLLSVSAGPYLSVIYKYEYIVAVLVASVVDECVLFGRVRGPRRRGREPRRRYAVLSIGSIGSFVIVGDVDCCCTITYVGKSECNKIYELFCSKLYT